MINCWFGFLGLLQMKEIVTYGYPQNLKAPGPVSPTINKVVATQRLFIFTPKIGEDSQFDSYFPRGLKPPMVVDGRSWRLGHNRR